MQLTKDCQSKRNLSFYEIVNNNDSIDEILWFSTKKESLAKVRHLVRLDRLRSYTIRKIKNSNVLCSATIFWNHSRRISCQKSEHWD